MLLFLWILANCKGSFCLRKKAKAWTIDMILPEENCISFQKDALNKIPERWASFFKNQMSSAIGLKSQALKWQAQKINIVMTLWKWKLIIWSLNSARHMISLKCFDQNNKCCAWINFIHKNVQINFKKQGNVSIKNIILNIDRLCHSSRPSNYVEIHSHFIVYTWALHFSRPQA